MNRRDELMTVFKNTSKDRIIVINKLIDEMLYVEDKLTEIKNYPMIIVSKKNPELAKPTAMSKLYKDLLASYTVVVKSLESMLGIEDKKEESPLRAYMKRLSND